MNRRRISWSLALGASLLTSAALWPAPAAAESDLSGRWVMAQFSVTVAEVPVVGKIYATSRTVTLHDLEQDGDRLHGPGVLCQLELDSGSTFVTTKLPEAFKRSLPRPHIDARLGTDEGGNVTFRQGRRTVVVGAKLDDPSKDPLPRKPSDPEVFDQDRDGHPGVTIAIDGIVSGEIYVAQRSWTKLAGSMVGREGFAGRLEHDSEQNILEATSSMLDDPPPQKPLPSKSWFRMTRLGADATCKTARAVAARWLK